MQLKIKDYKARDGRRYSLIFDMHGDGFPLYYPTAFISLRTASLSANTQRIQLYVLKKAHEWADRSGIDLEHRFATKTLFSATEVDSLVQALSINARENDGTVIKGNKINYSLEVLITYFGWLFGHYIADSNSQENKERIEWLQDALKARKVRGASKAREKRRKLTKKLSTVAEDTLLDLFVMAAEDTFAAISAFQKSIAFRNILALRILFDTGMRMGELLGLRYPDFIPATGGDHAYLRIERNHDDQFDRRMNQPVQKTLGRKLPISSELEKMLYTYLGTYRADIPNVGFTDNSFIFVNHKQGENQGREIEISTFRSALAVIIKRHSNLKGLHPHLLRHHWNYQFSVEATKRKLSDSQARSEREEWMGWSPGSESARDYDLRHIQESAYEHGIAIASNTARHKADRTTVQKSKQPEVEVHL
jgi:integrase